MPFIVLVVMVLFATIHKITRGATTHSVMHEKLTNYRCRDMEENGSRWQRVSRESLSIEGSRIASIAIRGECRFFGPIELKVDDHQFQIFDWENTIRVGKGVYIPVAQTVISLKTADLEIPSFYLYPNRGSRFVTREDNALLRYEEVVKTGTHIDGTYGLESIQPYHARQLFSTPTAVLELFEFVQSRQWTVQWASEQLLVYRQEEIVRPEALKYFAREVLQLKELLKQADAEGEAAMEEMLQRVKK